MVSMVLQFVLFPAQVNDHAVVAGPPSLYFSGCLNRILSSMTRVSAPLPLALPASHPRLHSAGDLGNRASTAQGEQGVALRRVELSGLFSPPKKGTSLGITSASGGRPRSFIRVVPSWWPCAFLIM